MKPSKTAFASIASVVLAMAIIAGPAVGKPILADPPSTQGNVVPVDVSAYADGASSINAITGAEQSRTPEATTVVKQSDGFDWDAALVGALGALGLVSISIVTAHAARRHGRFALGSRG
jgi:hypothetical protein